VSSAAKKVLIIEDDADARDALALVLASKGFELATAYDGETGIATAAAFHPDVLICDSLLPGIDGVAAARAIYAQTGAAIVFVTAHSLAELRGRSADLPVHAYLAKPIDGARLAAVLAEVG
jgi:two-component system CheB/CheR fusion protein